jgi:hypothetical protein
MSMVIVLLWQEEKYVHVTMIADFPFNVAGTEKVLEEGVWKEKVQEEEKVEENKAWKDKAREEIVQEERTQRERVRAWEEKGHKEGIQEAKALEKNEVFEEKAQEEEKAREEKEKAWEGKKKAREEKERARKDTTWEEKAQGKKAREEKAREEKARQEKAHEEKAREVKEREDKVQEEKVREEKPLEEKALEEGVLDEKLQKEKVQERELNDSMLLQKVSGGQALHGILITTQKEDRLLTRQCLLEAPKKVMMALESRSDTKIVEFSSEYQANVFIDALTRDTAVFTRISLYEAAMGAERSGSCGAEDEAACRKNYSSTINHSIVEVASYSFKNKELKLSEDPKRNLHEVLKLFKVHGAMSGHVEEKCEKFLRTYGSHVSKGPLKFGGKFLLVCASHSFDHEEAMTVNIMQNDAVSATAGISLANIGASAEVDIGKIKLLYKDKCSESTRVNTYLQVTITGGPPAATDLPQWKAGLVDNNKTWILTDRGKTFIPVWEIIRMNHKELEGICDVLKTTWEKISGLKPEEILSVTLLYDSKTVLDKVKKWKKEILTSQELQCRLEYLSAVKKEILENTISSIWIREYLSDPILQKFLVSVVDTAPSKLMKLLVMQEELTQFNTKTFPGIEQVLKSLYDSSQPLLKDVPNFESFDSFMKMIQEKARGAMSSGKSSSASHEAVAANVERAITSLRSHYEQTYDDVFITILVHPFRHGTLKDLEKMRKRFSEQRKKFNQYQAKPNPLQLQAYLLKLAVKFCDKANCRELLQQIVVMMKELNPPLQQELEECLYTSSLMVLRDDLKDLMTKPQFPPLTAKSLRDALKREVFNKQRILFDVQPPVLDKDPTICTLFAKIGLDNFYPKKLKLKHALCIRRDPLIHSLKETPPTDPKKLPYLVLHKLMAYDTNCRSDLMPYISCVNTKEFDGFDGYNEDSAESYDGIHPVDTLLALILCSDDFLRQDLFSRLAKCQLSVPFILPDPFTKQLTIPLWAMRSIIKEWKCTNSSGEVVQLKTEPIVSYPMPIVSFICFQKQRSGKSKSMILNEVISNSHRHFFHRDCPGGHYKSLLGEGLVDMSWYLPTGHAADAFPDAVTFLNLHGDARQHPQQSKFLGQISFVCVVLLTEKETDEKAIEILKMFTSCPGGILLLDSIGVKPEKVMDELEEISARPTAINLTKKNASDVSLSIQKYIKIKMFGETLFQTLEKRCCNIRHSKIFIDEDKHSYRESRILAEKITSGISAGKKEKMLPLQGNGFWKTLATLDREMHRQSHIRAQTVGSYMKYIRKQKKDICEEQQKHLEALSPVMSSFIEALLKLQGLPNGIVRNYYIQCLKLELDRLSRKSMSGMQYEYQEKRRELAKLQGKGVSQASEVKKVKHRMKVLQDGIINASIGLEHLFREVGQVFEAAIAFNSAYGDEIFCLPRAAAEMFIDGYPLEVMDGDAAHVPQNWVTAVFNEAVKMLKDPKVFVLSVLGLQSTGKSTMLNTVFGLQFNVGAGRCTRGAYIQLLPLDENLRRDTGCNYVLVVDTEGLRPIEHDMQTVLKHDNEIATFVIGLANMTLINIYGEVPGDMDDILQTSVHAFLRMREVNISPSCQFVHQNAGSNAKTDIGRTKFTQKLNKLTVDAAMIEEHCKGEYENFNDVIKFDDQEDVHHFPGLWKGDPPMAPVNDGYSYSAQSLKLSCVKALDKRGTKGQVQLSSFCEHLQNLWKALLKENFVFSFKNTLEIAAYNSLETEYTKWAWELSSGMSEWQLATDNEIRATKPEDVPDLVKQKEKDLEEHFGKNLYPLLEAKMKDFFKGKQAEILVQWSERFDTKLCNLSEELKHHAKKMLIQSQNAISKIESEQAYAKKIAEKVQEYIKNFKSEQQRLDENLGKQMLEDYQLKKLLDKKLFTPKKLDIYKDKKLVNQQQINRIEEIMSCGQLMESDLKRILIGGILEVDQVMKILKIGQQTVEQLKQEFNTAWKDIENEVEFPEQEKIDWEVEVEKNVRDRMGSHQGKLVTGHFARNWSLAGSSNFVPQKGKHYSTPGGPNEGLIGHVRKVIGATIEEDTEVQEVTKRILHAAGEFLVNIERKETDINPALIQELLQHLDKSLHKETHYIKGHLLFTQVYRLDIFLTVCRYAIPKFTEMRESYWMKHGPRQYLERHMKGRLFAEYKNQYKQAKAEEALSNTLCAHFEEPIKIQVRNKLGTKIVGLMKGSDPAFSSKMALKAKILIELYEEDKFESYMNYIRDVKGFLEEKLRNYAIKFCDEKVYGESTMLQETAKQEVTQLVGVITKVNLPHATDVTRLIAVYSEDKDLKKEIGVRLDVAEILAGHKSLEELNLENFKHQITNGLRELQDRLISSFGSIQCESEMIHWKDKFHILLQSLIGCTEQCPFCGEQCDLLDPNHINSNRDHSVEVHRSSCLRGYRDSGTSVMGIGFCPAYVSGKETWKKFRNADTFYTWRDFKQYRLEYAEWFIPPDVTSKNSLYWKMFVGKYMKEIARKYGAQPAEVPDEWLKISWGVVRESLRSLYHY